MNHTKPLPAHQWEKRYTEATDAVRAAGVAMDALTFRIAPLPLDPRHVGHMLRADAVENLSTGVENLAHALDNAANLARFHQTRNRVDCGNLTRGAEYLRLAVVELEMIRNRRIEEAMKEGGGDVQL